jgi:hypothetical protein
MKRIVWVSLCVLLCLTACSALVGSPAVVAPVPAQTDIQPEEWATRYPNEYNDWKDSVHGVAYLSGNSDAPGCTDCHSDPEAGEIETPTFHLEIPSQCARCHADEAVMSKYGVATDVYDTYRADYHGTTIEYHRAKDPATWRYEAVCSDCHESHAVYGSDDSKSSVASANLLATCQQCHPGASPSFTVASSGHYRTTRQASLLVYCVKLFYTALIPLIIGLMLAYIGLDISHRLRKKSKGEES